jgi:glycosyltransferase involved in cell wall biosynthesis
MKIGVNLLYIIPGKIGGTETYIRNLLNELLIVDQGNEYIIYLTDEARESFCDINSKAAIVSVGNFKNKVMRILWEQFVFPFVVKTNGVQVLFSPGYVIPLLAPCKHVVTIHDMLFRRYPQTIHIIKRLYWKMCIPLSIKYADVVITVSEFSKREIEKYYPSFQNKIVVTPEAVDRKIFYKTVKADQNQLLQSVPKKFMLCVATLNPHKNVEILLTAISVLNKKNQLKVNLVLIGNKERALSVINLMMENEGINDQIKMLGYVSTEELCSLYSAAQLFILPSLYEGFGLPILEAMSCGCPVISSNAASMMEVGGMAASYFDPVNVNDLVEKIKQVYFNESMRSNMIELGYRNIEKFDWSITAKLTLNAINSL